MRINKKIMERIKGKNIEKGGREREKYKNMKGRNKKESNA